jgi:hypothetical protein
VTGKKDETGSVGVEHFSIEETGRNTVKVKKEKNEGN